MSDVLAVGAHPDDLEIFAGGTLAAFVRKGASVHMVHLSRGELSTRGTTETRAVEAVAAAAELGASTETLDLGDGQLADDSRCRAALVALIRQERPKVLLGPYADDDHPDHSAVGRLVKSAWFLGGVKHYAPEAGPAHRPGKLWFYFSHILRDPTFLLQLETSDIEAMMRSVRCYASQFHDPSSPDPETRLSKPGYQETLLARRQHFGALIGAQYAEPIWTPGPLAVTDPLSLVSLSTTPQMKVSRPQ